MQEDEYKLGEIQVGGKINVQDISFHCLEIGGKRIYECQIILDINMVLNDKTEVKHLSKLRWKIKDEEVNSLKENGFIMNILL